MKIEEIKNLVEDYDKTYRADGLAPFVISKLFISTKWRVWMARNMAELHIFRSLSYIRR